MNLSNNHYVISNHISSSISNAVTISAAIRTTDFNTQWQAVLCSSGRKVEFSIHNGGLWVYSGSDILTLDSSQWPITPPANNEWFIYSLIFDGTNCRIFINETEIHSQAHTTIWPDATETWIGSYPHYPSGKFQGDLASLIIFDTVIPVDILGDLHGRRAFISPPEPEPEPEPAPEYESHPEPEPEPEPEIAFYEILHDFSTNYASTTGVSLRTKADLENAGGTI